MLRDAGIGWLGEGDARLVAIGGRRGALGVRRRLVGLWGRRESRVHRRAARLLARAGAELASSRRSEEHTSELQSPYDLVCRLLLEKKNHSDSSTSSLQTNNSKQ